MTTLSTNTVEGLVDTMLGIEKTLKSEIDGVRNDLKLDIARVEDKVDTVIDLLKGSPS